MREISKSLNRLNDLLLYVEYNIIWTNSLGRAHWIIVPLRNAEVCGLSRIRLQLKKTKHEKFWRSVTKRSQSLVHITPT